jgi:predicted outer membrane repeat protein
VLQGYTWLEHVTIVDADLATGAASSQGGGLFLGTTGTIVKGNGLYINTTDNNVNMGSHLEIGKGGGVYLSEGTVMNMSNLVCEGLAASNGPCIFAFTASLEITGGTIARSFGFDESNQAAAIYLQDSSWCSLIDVSFISNRLHPLNTDQKGSAVYLLASELVMDRVSFFNHSSVGSGGSIYAESLSTITGRVRHTAHADIYMCYMKRELYQKDKKEKTKNLFDLHTYECHVITYRI